jgi:hypothetical protein
VVLKTVRAGRLVKIRLGGKCLLIRGDGHNT